MLRDYQLENAEKGAKILQQYKIVYLAMEMRTGKTLTAFKICEIMKLQKVLMISKKKAVESGTFDRDYRLGGFDFELTTTNYEQTSKYVGNKYDVVIIDESHLNSAYPKASQRQQNIKKIVGDSYLIMLSGTPNPESYSQLYHQFDVSKNSPFANYKNFYRWASDFVDIKQKVFGGIRHNDYSKGREGMIKQVLEPYFIRFSQEDAGFEQYEVKEELIQIDINPRIYDLVNILLKEKIFETKTDELILCDTAAKLQQKIHQLFSGTIKFESKNRLVLDLSKARYIKNNYSGKKIAIYYKFIAEKEALSRVFDNLTEDPNEFKHSTNKIFISQIQSGSMGINLATADILIFYNIDFSAANYWQARARLQALERNTVPEVHYLVSKDGIEKRIYETVQKKKDYTLYYFSKDFRYEKDFRERYSSENTQLAAV